MSAHTAQIGINYKTSQSGGDNDTEFAVEDANGHATLFRFGGPNGKLDADITWRKLLALGE